MRNYLPLLLSCECGSGSTLAHAVGLTVNHQLLVESRCHVCGREMALVKPLADCWRDCPTEDDLLVAALLADESSDDGDEILGAEDAAFLKSLGIRPDDISPPR
jgi:hypothetical protein